MVYRLRPLELDFEFEDRPYKLGEAIRLTLDMKPKRDVHVREARVDLVCQERYSETSTLSMEMPVSQSGGGAAPGTRILIGTTPVTKEVRKELKETHVHSSVVFLKDTTVSSLAPGPFNVELEIEPDPPPHAEEAKELVKDPSRSWSFKWTLVATVNVVRGRNPKSQRSVKVVLD